MCLAPHETLKTQSGARLSGVGASAFVCQASPHLIQWQYHILFPLEELTFLHLMWLWWGHQSCVSFAAPCALPWPEQEFLWLDCRSLLLCSYPSYKRQTSFTSIMPHFIIASLFTFWLIYSELFCGLQPNSLTHSSCVLKACHGQVG